MAYSIKNGEIDYWDVESDQAHNFKYYFRKNNPDKFNEVEDFKTSFTKKFLNFQ